MERKLLNVANIKHYCLSNGGHSVQFVIRFGKFIQSPNRVSRKLHKFRPHISAYKLSQCRFMVNKNMKKRSD